LQQESNFDYDNPAHVIIKKAFMKTKIASTAFIFFWIGGLLLLGVLYFFAFQYARMTDFPIGEDPAVHINLIKTSTYLGLTRSIYPLPLIIFKFFSQTVREDLPKLFTVLISTYLFTTALALFFLVYRQYQNASVAAASAILFVTARWVNDSLRMGTLSEVFGWSVFLFALYCLSSQKIIPILIASCVLAFSHPFAFIVYSIIAFLYLVILLQSPQVKEKKFATHLFIVAISLVVVVWIVHPDLVRQFLHFQPGDPSGWGDRNLWEILTRDDIRRILIPLVAIIGIASSLKEWNKPIIKLMFLLLLVGGFFSLNHVFDIHFLTFRFYAYLEMAIAFFAAVGLSFLMREFKLPSWIHYCVVLACAIFLSWPNYQVNFRYLRWQTTDPHANAVLFPEDRDAIAWIRSNTSQTATFIGDHHFIVWIMALADRQQTVSTDDLYQDTTAIAFITNNKATLAADYIYFPTVSPPPPSLKPYLNVVYNSQGVTIAQIKNPITKTTH